jgi:ectoine hydroxylase-related dioxygenase (phytanoyl-CoA dioxygenase family)
MLSISDIERYQRDGYIIVPDLLRPAQIATLQAVIDQWMANASTVDTHDDIYDLEPGHTRAAPRVQAHQGAASTRAAVLDVARSEPVLAVLSCLLGPNLRLHGSKLNIKAPQYGSPVEWHQDWAFYPHTNDDILAIGVMLDDMDLVNGPLLVVPGSHRGPVFDHHYARSLLRCGRSCEHRFGSRARECRSPARPARCPFIMCGCCTAPPRTPRRAAASCCSMK